MIRIFYITCLSILFFPVISLSQDTKEVKLTEEMISKYVTDTNATLEEISLESYKNWIGLYLNAKSELEVNSTIKFENKNPVITTVTLNQNQFLAASTSETQSTKSYKISNANIDAIKIFKNGKSAIINRSHDFEKSTKSSWKPVTSIGTMNCQELIMVDEWSSKPNIARSICNIKATTTRQKQDKQ